MTNGRDEKGRFARGNQIAKGNKGGHGGRPVGRVLTEILRLRGDETIAVEGKAKKVARKRVVAMLLWQAVTMGAVEFPDGRIVVLEASEWIQSVRWLYRQVDGDAPQYVQVEDVTTYAKAAAAVRDAIVNGNGDPSSD